MHPSITHTKLLLVEDNRSLSSALIEAFQGAYEVDHVGTAKAGIYKAEIHEYDVILLDLQLPDMSGLDVCQHLRERGVQTPILIVSAEAKVLSKINLLDAGANDYLTKPFSLGELKARIRVLMRTPALKQIQPLTKTLTVGGIVMDIPTHQVTRDGITIPLRRKEFLLLECLMLQPERVISREMLIEYAWPPGMKPWANTVDVHMKYLRDKIDRPFATPYIHTVHGLGYKMTALKAAKALV